MRPGDRIGAYALVRPLGKGGFGTVWQARGDDGAAVALKILHRVEAQPRGPSTVERFLAEARMLQEIRHPGVVRVLGVIDARPNGPIAYAMELLEGHDLASLRPQLDSYSLAELFQQTAQTLAYLHQRGILHRDVKPQNIFVVRTEGRRIAKLIDFGIAKELDGLNPKTATGHILGTLRSVAPETFRKLSGEPVELTPAVDQWALGVALYRMLANSPPFTATALFPLMEQVTRQPPPPLRLAPPFEEDPITDALISVAMRCLEKAPHQRFASMSELAANLANICEPTLAQPERASNSEATEFRGVHIDADAGFATDSETIDPLAPRPLNLEWALAELPVPERAPAPDPSEHPRRPELRGQPARPSPPSFVARPALRARPPTPRPWQRPVLGVIALLLAFFLGWWLGGT